MPVLLPEFCVALVQEGNMGQTDRKLAWFLSIELKLTDLKFYAAENQRTYEEFCHTDREARRRIDCRIDGNVFTYG
eukprot:769318-Rhodomonas_salina.1